MRVSKKKPGEKTIQVEKERKLRFIKIKPCEEVGLVVEVCSSLISDILYRIYSLL
jgi:hypothetical protein